MLWTSPGALSLLKLPLLFYSLYCVILKCNISNEGLLEYLDSGGDGVFFDLLKSAILHF